MAKPPIGDPPDDFKVYYDEFYQEPLELHCMPTTPMTQAEMQKQMELVSLAAEMFEGLTADELDEIERRNYH
jgi:hypothetical protein